MNFLLLQRRDVIRSSWAGASGVRASGGSTSFLALFQSPHKAEQLNSNIKIQGPLKHSPICSLQFSCAYLRKITYHSWFCRLHTLAHRRRGGMGPSLEHPHPSNICIIVCPNVQSSLRASQGRTKIVFQGK